MDASALQHMEKMLRDDAAKEFDILRPLGRGGMAMVYLAVERKLSRKVAIKVLPPELTFGHGVDRFMREAKTAAALDHPHIIPIYRIASEGKLFWYAMKYLEGKSLDDMLKERERMDLPETIEILTQVADALDYAHEHKVIHRDIKPANVMLDGRNRVILTDFGIAKALTEGTLTASGSVIGTPYYMSPEQGMGKPVTGAADQYSVGVMTYRMLAGQVPFEGDSAIDILHKQCMMPPPPLEIIRPGLPSHAYRAVVKALEKDPAARFKTVSGFVKALAGTPRAEDQWADTPTVAMPSMGGATGSGGGAVASGISGASGASSVRSGKTGTPGSKRGIDRISTEVIQTGSRSAKKKSKTPLYAAIGGGVVVLGVVAAIVVSNTGKTAATSEATPPESTSSAQGQRLGAGGTSPATAPAKDTGTGGGEGAPAADAGDRAGSARGAGNRGNGSAVRESPTGANPAREGAARPQTQTQTQQTVPPPVAPMAGQDSVLLRISVDPVARIFVDQIQRGDERGQWQQRVLPGNHLIRLEKDGFLPVDTTVSVKAGEAFTLRVTLKPSGS